MEDEAKIERVMVSVHNSLSSHFKCRLCDRAYEEELSFYAHIVTHAHQIMLSEIGHTPLNAYERRHIASMHLNKENQSPTEDWKKGSTGTKRLFCRNKIPNFSCGECGRTFPSEEKYEYHLEFCEVKPHQCDVCLKKYKSKSSLKMHMKSTHESNLTKYKCETCEKVFSDQHKLQHHEKVSHSESLKVNCEICGKNVKKYLLNSHKKTHKLKEDFQCKICLMVFQEKEHLKNHLAEHESKNYECDMCKKCFRTKKMILLHLVKTHLNNHKKMAEFQLQSTVMKIDKTKRKKKNKNQEKREKPYKCDEENCQYSTSQYSLLKTHKFKHNPFYKCITCEEKFRTRPELKSHMSAHGDRPYKCDQCHKSYKDRHGLGWHKKVQHDPSRLKFTCELCGKTYPFDSLLTQHINLSHASEKQSVCDICGKNVSKTYLTMHRRTHGEKQYNCDVCQKSFIEKAYLKRHKMIHTGEKPYVCSVCGNLFRQHSTLTIHMRTHTGDRPYKCVLCENAYKTHHNLKKHYRRTGHKMV